MASTRTRGSAASKLLKGIPELDEGYQAAQAGLPDPEGSGGGPAIESDPTAEMPSAPQAAEGRDEAGAEGPMPPPDGAPQDAPAETGGGQDLDTALAGVEASIQGMSEDSAREIRTHLEAIKDIASREPEFRDQNLADNALPQDIPGPEAMPPGPEMGMEEKV